MVKMTVIFRLCLILCLSFSHVSFAFNPSLHTRFLAQKTLFDFESLQSGTKNLTSYHFAKEDQVAFEKIAKFKDPELKMKSQENWILVEYKDSAAIIEFLNNKIFLNGKELKLSPQISISQSLKNWSLAHSKAKKNSHNQMLFDFLIPKAQAQIDPLTYATITSVGHLENFAMNYAVGEMLAGSGAAAGGGSALVIGGVVIGLVALAGLGICEVNVRAYGNPTAKGRLNCYSQPLSWVNLNPRDNLYLQEITCLNESIVVKLESKTEKIANLTFTFKNSELSSVTRNYGLKPSEGVESLQASSLENKQQKKDFEDLKADSKYYQQLCKDPAKMERLKQQVDKARIKGSIFTDQPKAKAPGAK